jgi:hypothetical protein
VSEGISFGGPLTILFIGLKLTGYLAWSWIWVLSPLWLPLVIVLSLFAGALGIGVLAVLFGGVVSALSRGK